MTHTLASITGFVFIFSALMAAAESPKPPPQLVLSAALHELEAHNPLLRAYSEETISRRAAISPQAALEDPVIEVGLEDYSASDLNSRTPGAGQVFGVRQLLPFPGKRTALRAVANSEWEASKFELAAKRRETIAEFKASYFKLALAYASQALLQVQLKLLRNLLELARRNYALSKVSQADVLTLQVEEALLLDQELESHSQIETLLAEANHFLGREGNPKWRPEPLTAGKLDRPALSRETLLAHIYESNPALKGLEQQTKALGAKERYSKLGNFPDFELSAAYKLRQQSDLDRGGADEVSAGIGLSIPLWAGTKQHQLVEKSAADRRKSEALEAELKNELMHALHRSLAAIDEGRARLHLARSALLPLASSAVLSAQSAYGSGGGELVAVLALLRSRYAAELRYQELLAEQHANLAQLDKLLGGGLEQG